MTDTNEHPTREQLEAMFRMRGLSATTAVSLTTSFLNMFDVTFKPELPKCEYCGADCPDGQKWRHGGDDYLCPRCARDAEDLWHTLGNEQSIGKLLRDGWRRTRATMTQLETDVMTTPAGAPLASHLWAQGWRR
jgi:hypothetical protein